MKRGIVRVSSPFGSEGDLLPAAAFSEGEGRTIHENLLGVIGFITDFYTAIACCACRSGG